MPPLKKSETELFVTAGEMIPYTAPLVKAYKFLIAMYDFGKDDKHELAIDALKKEVRRIQAELNFIHLRLEELEARMARIENRERMRLLTEQANALELEAFRLSKTTAPEVALRARQIANIFFTDSDLWLWSDLRKIIAHDEQGRRTERESFWPADFKSFPAMPVYALALATWMEAMNLEAGGDVQLIRARHGEHLRQHIDHVSTRPEFDNATRLHRGTAGVVPKTIPEQIKARLTCRAYAITKYAVDRECRFGILCEDELRRTSQEAGEVTVTMREDRILCTFDPQLGGAEEAELHYRDDGLGVLTQLQSMMRRIELTGSWSEEWIGHFPGTSSLELDKFRVADFLAVEEGAFAAFPTFKEKPRGREMVGTVVFLYPSVGERRDVPVTQLGDVSPTDFGSLMRAVNSYASQNGFVGGFPTGPFNDYGEGAVCTVVLLSRDGAEWNDVYRTDLKQVPIDRTGDRFSATHDYAVANDFIGGFPNLFHAEVGGEPISTRRAGTVYGTLLIKPGHGESRDVVVFRGLPG